MLMIRNPKNITNKNECAFGIGVEGNPEKSIQEMLDSKPSGYRSKEEIPNSVSPIFEDLTAMNAFGKGYAISQFGKETKTKEETKLTCSSLQEYCIGCGFNKDEGCGIPLDLYEMVSANGLRRRD